MDLQDLAGLLRDGEGISVEFKRCGGLPQSDTFETICSFANRQGGNILLGVLNDGTVEGIKADSSLEIRRNIVNCTNNSKLFNAPPQLEMEEL